MPDGNCQGYAHDRVVAVNPVAEHPTKTLVHELAHVILGHTEKDVTMVDTDVLSRDVKEMEAEAVALLVGDALELDGAAESRGYIQHWYGKDRRIDDANARRIISAADKVLRAGRPEKKQSKKEDA